MEQYSQFFEGVVEAQAISWFAQGCRHGSMLWQKLQRKMPATLAETMRIADTYTLGDPMQPLVDVGDSNRRNAGPQRSGPSRSHDRQDLARKVITLSTTMPHSTSQR